MSAKRFQRSLSIGYTQFKPLLALSNMGRFVLVSGLLALGVSGCETAKRLAPPGFIKYEDLEKGIPVDPDIQARIDAYPQEREVRFPNLSQGPQELPEGLAESVRLSETQRLLQLRDQSRTDISRSRKEAQSEFEVDENGQPLTIQNKGLTDDLEDLKQSIAKGRREVTKEQKEPLPKPIDTTGAPEQKDPFDDGR